jgi:hypothetical protein
MAVMVDQEDKVLRVVLADDILGFSTFQSDI